MTAEMFRAFNMGVGLVMVRADPLRRCWRPQPTGWPSAKSSSGVIARRSLTWPGLT